MATIVTGADRSQARHSPIFGSIGFMISMAIPVAVILIGIAAEGLGAISWLGAIVWGIVATMAFTLFSMAGKAMGMTRMDLLDLLGSTVAPPNSTKSRAVGAAIHHMNGAVLAVSWVYATLLVGVAANWFTAVLWGAVLWLLTLLMMSTIGTVHPAIRKGEQEDPGVMATNFGALTPIGSLMGHLVWGAVLGFLYALWPLSVT